MNNSQEKNRGSLHNFFHSLLGGEIEIDRFGVPLSDQGDDMVVDERVQIILQQVPGAELEDGILWIPESYEEESFKKIYDYVLYGIIDNSLPSGE